MLPQKNNFWLHLKFAKNFQILKKKKKKEWNKMIQSQEIIPKKNDYTTEKYKR